MKRFLAVLVVMSAVLSPTPASADGLFVRLPEDGAWAKYDLEIDTGQLITATLTVKSVGKETVDGVECRWIEVVLDGPTKVIFKVLAPEDQLKAGGSPLENAKKLLLDQGSGTAAEISDKSSPRIGPFAAFLGGPLADAEELEAKKIKTDAGEFECKGVKGKYELTQGSQDIDATIESRFSDSPEAAFGVVEYHLEFSVSNGQQGGLDLTLKEVGKDAKAETEVKNDDGK